MADWLIPELSLAKQLNQETDRRAAATLDRNGLSMLADKLICDWYQQRETIERLMKRVQELEVRLILVDAKPSNPEPKPEHFKWARELLAGFMP